MTKVTMEFDYFEDRDHLKSCMAANDTYGVIAEVRQYIRAKLKHEERTEGETAILETIREILQQVDID